MDVGLPVPKRFRLFGRCREFHCLVRAEFFGVKSAAVYAAGRGQRERIQKGHLPLVVRFFRVHITRRSNYVIRWQRDTHVKRTVFRVKLALIQIRHGVPTVSVVHRGFGVPLSDLVRFANVA